MAKKKAKNKRQETALEEIRQEPVPSTPPPSALTDREARNKVLKVIGQILAVFVLLIVMIWGRAYYFQQKFYREGEKALKEHNYKDAMTGYEWAIRMYTPFSGKVKDSCQKLWLIAEEYEKRGRLNWALITYRSLRSSIYAIRSFYTPYEEWIPRTDARIRRILEIQKARERQRSAQQKKSGNK